MFQPLVSNIFPYGTPLSEMLTKHCLFVFILEIKIRGRSEGKDLFLLLFLLLLLLLLRDRISVLNSHVLQEEIFA